MQLSYESYRTRWLILVGVWSLCAFTHLSQILVVRSYLDTTGALGNRGSIYARTPLIQIYPAFGADAQTWVRHSLSLIEGDSVRLRQTTIDNAPVGREVHWNSAWAWAIAGAGRIRHMFTGEPMTVAVERATLWLGPFVLMLLTMFFSAWATRRAGAAIGVLVAVAMTCNDRIYEGFFPTYVDHHGLLTISVFGMMLGAVFMGGGWWKARNPVDVGILPDSPVAARTAAFFSGLSGACGLWVSAASAVPPVALVGTAGALMILIQGRSAQQQGALFDPQVWRTWGRTGALASFFFYLLEYFPNHLSLRLEPNHPFYSLAWFGAGEVIAELSTRWLAARDERWTNLPALARRLALPLAALAVAPIVILIARERVFSPVFDTFMVRLHNDYIQEFLPIWVTVRSLDTRSIVQMIGIDNLALIAAIATLSYLRRDAPVVLWLGTIAALLFNALAWTQTRWLLNASGVQVCLVIVLLGCWLARYRPAVRWGATLLVIFVMYVPSGIIRYVGANNDVKARRVAPRDATGTLHRDIAASIRESQPQGDITLLTSPNASTGIGYYGRFKTLGTLYWENSEGLKAAAAIYSAESEDEAARLVKKHGVTHIAILSEENFIAQYFTLLRPKATQEDFKKSFGYRLLYQRTVPQWLQMLPYRLPDDLTSLKQNVMLFKVNFQQNLAEALYNVALAQIAAGAIAEGEQALDILLRDAPQIYQPWLRKGELLLARHAWPQAAEHMLKGIALAPAAERPALYVNSGGSFYMQGQHALALKIYRTGFAEHPSAELACFIAWILATSKEDALRNAKEALPLAEAAVKANPNNPTFLNSLAAAFAEAGQFAEADEVANRALANARLAREANVIQVSEQNLAAIRARQPIRK